MRKSIDGLSILVSRQLQLDPFAGHLFGFCNRSRTIIKLLYWDRNGFCLWHKRLERPVFRKRKFRPFYRPPFVSGILASSKEGQGCRRATGSVEHQRRSWVTGGSRWPRGVKAG